MNELINISGVSGFLDDDGVAQLHLESVARGLGFTQLKNNVEYVRWETINGYLESFGFSQQAGKGWQEGFIPENIFYRLAMKAKNETAEKFQAIVADEILPAIRKTGTYGVTIPKTLPEALRLAADLEEQKEALQIENAQSKQIIQELRPKATYYDLILQNKSLLPITKIAKDYGMSGYAMNEMLHELGIQYKMGDTWLLYQKFADKGYTQSKTHVIDDEKNAFHTYWTQAGRLFIYAILKVEKNILPLIER